MTSNGYKEIKIGPRDFTIPIDWEVLDIENTSTLKGRIGWQGLTTKEYLNKGNFYLITGTDFKNGRIYWDNCHYVEKERYQQDNNIQIKEKDVLITKDGTIGKVALIDKFPSHPATLNSGVFVLRPIENSYLPEYMYHYLKSYFFKSFINDIKAGSTIAHLYQKDFNKFQFICPPTIEEQNQIAEILSTVDDAIEKTAAIIEESRQLKKGLMQKLFTEGIGHTRFKETKIGKIPETWETVKLKEYTKIIMGQSPSSSDCNDEIRGLPFFQGNGEFGSKYPIAKHWTTNPTKIAQPDDILMSVRAPVGEFNISNCICCIGRGLCAIRPSVQIDLYFTYYCLKSSINRLKRLEQGSTFSAVNKTDITTFEIPFPPIDEQRQISKILSEVDAKIEKEEATKAELEQLKKGLMQVLLTGKVRVMA
jgi:type I restriction enzyme, S subunit